jgi:phosphoserine phosphatase
MRISFDFDDTLTHPLIQQCARGLITDGHEVYILTARFSDLDTQMGSDWNDDLKALAAELDIPPERWLFAGLGTKAFLASAHKIELHIDDAGDWVREVREVCPAIQFNEHAPEDSIERFLALVKHPAT